MVASLLELDYHTSSYLEIMNRRISLIYCVPYKRAVVVNGDFWKQTEDFIISYALK